MDGVNTGYIYGALKTYAQPDSVPSHRNPADRIEYAVMAFHFKHPTHGDILIDTGFDRTFHNNPPYGNLSFTMRVYATLMNVQYTQRPSDIDLMSHLKKHQITPTHVFLTHLHADHTGGAPGTSLADPSLLWKTGTDTPVPAAVWQSFCGEIVYSSA